MARKFIGAKEIAFINRVTAELIQAVVIQEVLYYTILAEKTHADDLYNESIKKVWSAPVKINALVFYENTTEKVGSMPPDAQFNLDVYFHKHELDQRNCKPKMGDFVLFGNVLFEIMSVTQPQMVFGQIENKVMTKCNCKPARKGQFNPPTPLR
jgi:hypothetical protein